VLVVVPLGLRLDGLHIANWERRSGNIAREQSARPQEEMAMTTTHDIEPGRRIDLTCEVVGFDRADRRARIVEQPGGPPQRIDGFTVGAPELTGDAPHNGELHPDGDELLYMVSGAVTVRLELAEGDRTVELSAGDALVVPKAIWHRITLREPGQLIHITPGPNGDHRPLGASAR
jgi:mannose-6-phosphate isomerase-like protein (cupin superfamily)